MRRMALPDPPVDTRRERSVSFAPLDAPERIHRPGDRPSIPVGPGRPTIAAAQASGAHRDDVSGYPIQYAKVQPPPLREETLARHRLLDWLAAKIHHRVILVLADAGYGKTTLLADFSGRTRLRTLWYRLDEDDRDWISLLNHLVAAGREADPSFAPTTAAMLADTSLTGPTMDAVIEVFIRELQGIAPHGAVLIFDDFHLVDDAPDVQRIARELVTRAPERLSIVFASRRAPGIPMARLRSIGEVGELTTDDLRFDADETDRLFRESYGRTLDPDVLADVTARTEGWAASLQLVHAALRDRTPGQIRQFVHSLTGADRELYDYLAEEVIGDLPPDLQTFLMRTSILQVVTPTFAEIVTGAEAGSCSRLTNSAERLTLLSRRSRGPRSELRYHPLVQQFLMSRLTRELGTDGVRDLHRLMAEYAGSRDWRLAAHHLWSAGDQVDAWAVIDLAATGIVGRGEYLVAAPYLEAATERVERASFEVVLSRRDFSEGNIRGAVAHAEQAVLLEPRSDLALANLASQHVNAGNIEEGVVWARRLLSQPGDLGIQGIAAGIITIHQTSLDGDVTAAITEFSNLATQQHAAGYIHFEGISQLNLADAYRASGDLVASRRAAQQAVELLQSSSAGSEVQVAQAYVAWADAHLAELGNARASIETALATANDASRADVLFEASDLEAAYGSQNAAADHLAHLRATGAGAVAGQVASLEVLVALRLDNQEEALRRSESLGRGVPSSLIAHQARDMVVRAHAMASAMADGASDAIARAHFHAESQTAGLWAEYAAALRAVTAERDGLNAYVRSRGRVGLWPLSRVAELLTNRLNDLGGDEADSVRAEVVLRPDRWRSALRLSVDRRMGDGLNAARLLDLVGEHEDVVRLRNVAHKHRGRPDAELGRGLARRLAPMVFVEDLGRVSLRIGERAIEGSSVRRKVLALLCFLVTRPRFSATRDEVMDALWPDFDPGDAQNSLNQTVYFLRRVFEPDYKDDLSPGYVHHESDVIWLDEALVSSRSSSCVALIRSMTSEPTPVEVEQLSVDYIAPFALDFAYEEWAGDYRSSLHSSYLQVIEKAVTVDTASGHFDRGINLARRALDLSPDADQVELSLLRMLQLNGSHAAAAEQYSHYAAAQRDTYGIEPPALEFLVRIGKVPY